MQITRNIKKLRHEKSLMKMEKGEREFSIYLIDKPAKFFGLSNDELVFMNGKMPTAVTVEDKTTNEKVQLISQLEAKGKQALYRIIDGMPTKSKFQTFFEQNIQSAK